MKNLFKLFPVLFATIVLFSACSDDDDNGGNSGDSTTTGAYVINYGGYQKSTSSITKYDYVNDELTEYWYQLQNNYSIINSSPQWAYVYDDQVYLVNYSPDNLQVLNESFESQDTITTNVVKPRNCIGNGDYLYISCWGENPDWVDLPDSYLLKYNVTTGAVDEKIDLAGGPEGLQIANGKLYVALNYKQAVAVMDLTTEEISYIETPAVCSYFVKDDDDNLYVSLISSYSHSATETGLGFINTTTDALTVYDLDNVSTTYSSMMDLSKDGSKIYVVAAAYDASYNMVGGVQIFDTETKTFESSSLVTGITGINGVSVNPVDGKIYVYITNGSSDKGEMQIYSEDETFEETKNVGAAPAMTIFLN